MVYRPGVSQDMVIHGLVDHRQAGSQSWPLGKRASNLYDKIGCFVTRVDRDAHSFKIVNR